MFARRFPFAAVSILVIAGTARAELILEFVRVPAITAPFSNEPAITDLTMMPGETQFIQLSLRDTTGNTLAWNTNGGMAGPGSLGLGAFYLRFSEPVGVADNPIPTSNANARLVDGYTYLPLSSGSLIDPGHTRFGGLVNFGFEPGLVPNPAFQNRIPLFNLRIVALSLGTGNFVFKDPNAALGSADNAVLFDADHWGNPSPGYFQGIDQLLFGPNSVNTYALKVTVIPEPASIALAALGVGSMAILRRSRDKADFRNELTSR